MGMHIDCFKTAVAARPKAGNKELSQAVNAGSQIGTQCLEKDLPAGYLLNWGHSRVFPVPKVPTICLGR